MVTKNVFDADNPKKLTLHYKRKGYNNTEE
jgi:hypothetical protein